jgi:hypothetical protein
MGWVVSKGRAQVADGARATRAYGESRLEDAAGEVLGSRGVERAVERAFAGPLPEHVANAAVEQRVVQRMVAEVLASVDMQAAITAALERERAEGRLEQIVGEAARSEAAEEIAQRVVSSPELQRLIEEVIASDAVRTALARQSASFGSEGGGRAAAAHPALRRSHHPCRQDAGSAVALRRAAGTVHRRRPRPGTDVGCLPGRRRDGGRGVEPRGRPATVVAGGGARVRRRDRRRRHLPGGVLDGRRPDAGHARHGSAPGREPEPESTARRRPRPAAGGGTRDRDRPVLRRIPAVLFDRRRRAIQDMLAGTTVRLDDAHTSEGG